MKNRLQTFITTIVVIITQRRPTYIIVGRDYAVKQTVAR